jgi:hypothetical protein
MPENEYDLKPREYENERQSFLDKGGGLVS